MRILVVGGSGLIGSHVLREAKARGHAAIGTYRTRAIPAVPGLERLDGARLDDFEALLERHRPDAVVHAAGWTWVDGCEDDPERAMEENCRQPVRMAALCAARGVRFAYFSTSYVFDGTEPPYDESAAPRPLNAYGRSKHAAERGLEEATGGDALIARVICAYGEEARRKNFAYQVLDAMRRGAILRLPSDQSGNPTWAGDIARALITLLEDRETGIWHLGGPHPGATRMEWAESLIAAFAGAGVAKHPDFAVTGIPTAELGQKAPRPLRAGILSRRLDGPTLPSRAGPDVFRRIAEG